MRDPETLLVYGLDDLPESLTRAIPADSPFRSCLFWVAHPDSELIDALFDAIPEPTFDGEDEALGLALTIASAAATSRRFAELIGEDPGFDRFAGGFHSAGREPIEPWLRERATLMKVGEVLDEVLILQVSQPGEPFRDLMWKKHDAPDDELDALLELYESPGIYAIERADPAFVDELDLVFDEQGQRRVTLELSEFPDLVLEIDAENPDAIRYAGPDLDFD